MFYLQYHSTTGQLSYANAGHPHPLLLRKNRKESSLLDADGMILGIREQVTFEEKTVHLSPGDLILLYTDGLIEAENPQGEFFGLERVQLIFNQYSAQKPQKIIENLLAELKLFCQSKTFVDDITLMIFKRGE